MPRKALSMGLLALFLLCLNYACENGPPGVPTNTNSPYDQLKDGATAVFTTPPSMRLDETTAIELLVNPSKNAEQLQSELTEQGQSGNASTQYSKTMEAQLVSHGFNITAVGPSTQLVEAGRTTRWKWQIKPKEGGEQRLDLTLTAVLSDGKDRVLLQTLRRDITVNVKFSQRASGWLSGLKDMQWLWAAIIVPLGTFAIAWWRRRKKKQQPLETPETPESPEKKPRKKRSGRGKSAQP